MKLFSELSIRAKTTIYVSLAVSTTLILMIAGLYIAYLNRVETLESSQAEERFGQVALQLENSKLDLASTVADWAWWTDSYDFAQDENEEFIDDNLYEGAFVNLDVDVVVFADTSGTPIYNDWYRPEVVDALPVSALGAVLSDENLAPLDSKLDVAYETVVSDGRLILTATRNVLYSDETGDPAGTLTMGREVDDSFIESLRQLTGLDASIVSCNVADCGDVQEHPILTKDNDFYTITGVLANGVGEPIMEISVVEDRVIYKESTRAILGAIAVLGILGVAAVALTIVGLRRLIVKPLDDLGLAVADVARSSDPSLRAPVTRSDEIGRLAQEVNVMLARLEISQNDLTEAKDAVEAASKAKSKFLARVSHELRTPINGVLAYAQLLELDFPDGEANEFIGQIITSARHITELVDEFLDIARIESGSIPIEIHKVNAMEIAADVASMGQPLADGRNVNIELVGASEVFVLADQLRLRQAVLNLVSNAIKYGSEDSSVVVSVSTDAVNTSIAVIDQGTGIPDHLIDRLFVPFDRLEADGGDQIGSGLGLSVTRQLVELMGGTISVKSVLEVGTTFVISLPAPTLGPDTQAEESQQLDQMSIGVGENSR